MVLAGSNIGVRQKYRKPFLSKITHRKFLEKYFFKKIDIFGIFGPKTEKMGRVQKWVFFDFAHFFVIESKSIENTKKLSPQMNKVC